VSRSLKVQHFTRRDFAQRTRAAGLHLLASSAIAAIVAALVFALWYPWPYFSIAGGDGLFGLVVAIDVVVGPLLTFAVFDRRKPWAVLRRDLIVILTMQVAALGYGLDALASARPVVVALEANRLRVVRAVDLAGIDLSSAPAELRRLSWTGPVFVATRPATPQEMPDAVLRALAGDDVGMRPEFWLEPGATEKRYAAAAVPIETLIKRNPTRIEELREAMRDTNQPAASLGFIPILGRVTTWTALVDRSDGRIVGYVPIEGF
jgi:hypothetical protein